MSIDTRTSVVEDTAALELTDSERAEVRTIAIQLAHTSPRLVDSDEWVDAARRLSARLPLPLRETLRAFRRDPGPAGALLIRNLPSFGTTLPRTPTVLNSVQRSATNPASILALVTTQLGELSAFRAEKFGALIQDVVPVPGNEEFQGNAGSITLTMHVENAFHPARPDYVALLCLRNDHDNVAGLRTASIREAAALLPETTLRVLNDCRFVTEPPASFGGAGGTTTPHAILEGCVEDPNIRVDFTSTFPLDGEAQSAMAELGEALRHVRRTVILEPGHLAIVDNRVTLHGRTAFTPRYDGRDRWLQRAFVHLDARRTRPLRPGNANVLV